MGTLIQDCHSAGEQTDDAAQEYAVTLTMMHQARGIMKHISKQDEAIIRAAKRYNRDIMDRDEAAVRLHTLPQTRSATITRKQNVSRRRKLPSRSRARTPACPSSQRI